MSTHDLESGMDLVKKMTKGDLQTSWVMFDHIKKNAQLDNNGGTCVWSFLSVFIEHCFVWDQNWNFWVPGLVMVIFESIVDASNVA